MIWLTWRQFRVSALTVFGVLGAVVFALALTGPRLNREYADLRFVCGGDRCNPEFFEDFFFSHVGVYFLLNLLVIAVPVIVGLFWGAPLISREFETGTQDLVWQQSVPRRRWLAVKLGFVGLAAMAAAGLAAMVVSWWARPLDATAFTGITRLSPALFDARGYVAVGHAAFAFTLGVAAGQLIRRTLPAMAVTFVIFVAIQIVMPSLVRPHLATPERLEAVITTRNFSGIGDTDSDGTTRGILVDALIPGAWVLTNEVVDSAGRTADTLPVWVGDCATPEAPEGEIIQQHCLERLKVAGYRQVVTYHPADRFWPFQAYEAAIFGMLSLLLVGFCLLRIRPS